MKQFVLLIMSFPAAVLVSSFRNLIVSQSRPPHLCSRVARSHASLVRRHGSNSSSLLLSTNQDIVQRQLQVARAKREARQRSIEQRVERNFHLKKLFNATASNESAASAQLIAVKVSVDAQLRQELALTGREKRGRVFLSPDSPAVTSIQSLRHELHQFFRALKKNSFILRASYPILDDNGNLMSRDLPDHQDDESYACWWPIATDEDVKETFAKALAYFSENAPLLKRPSLLLSVEKDPNAPPPPPTPPYLTNLPDLDSSSSTMTMLSFYAFREIANPDEFALLLRKTWKHFGALGRVYVATEGVNAQMAVPTIVLEPFIQSCRDLIGDDDVMENGVNIDPIALSREEFATAGTATSNGKPTPPFTNLHIRVRQQIVADGITDKSYNWQSAGYDMPPQEWHERIQQAKSSASNQQKPILLDCRNEYESKVGIFEGAEPLNTQTFKETWPVLQKRLEGVPKDAPIMTYCTGGIRCVKVGAYLTQELGFTNVSRLAGGIIAYGRTIDQEESLFKGTNFVFDGRLGRSITDDAIGTCYTCGEATSLVSNCHNPNCHKRMIQCENCRTNYHGTCSEACRNLLLMRPMRAPSDDDSSTASLSTSSSSHDRSFSNLHDYALAHSSAMPAVYEELEANTRALIPSGSHMVSGSVQGRFLTLLACMTRSGRVLELGTFTGYATACLVQGVMNIPFEENEGGRRGPYVMSMERDHKAYEVAAAQLKIVSEHGFSPAAVNELSRLRNNDEESAPISSSLYAKENISSLSFDHFKCDLLLVSDALAVLQEIAAGRGGAIQPTVPFDLIFCDADKTRLLDYVDACLSSDKLLRKGGMIVVDNVLWKGLVLQTSNNSGDSSSSLSDSNHGDDDDLLGEDASALRKNRRARKLASTMHRFNDAIVQDDRAEVLVLPLRDGLSLIRKK